MHPILINGEEKPLGGKILSKIPHLSFSKLGKGDHHIDKGHEEFCTKKLPEGCLLRIQPKIDGSCVGVFNNGKRPIALSRAGYTCETSNWNHIKEFARYVEYKKQTFMDIIPKYGYLVGEFIWQRHTICYDTDRPFIPFDLFSWEFSKKALETHGQKLTRLSHGDSFWAPIRSAFKTPYVMYVGFNPVDKTSLRKLIDEYNKCPQHGETHPIEGVIYRVEKPRELKFIAKYVEPWFEPGVYMENDMKPEYCCEPYWRTR
jgi:hypothetical protein